MKKALAIICGLMLGVPTTIKAMQPRTAQEVLQSQIDKHQYIVNKKAYRLIQLAPRYFYFYKYRPFTEDWYMAECYLRTVYAQEYGEYLVENGRLEELKELQAYCFFDGICRNDR